LCVWEYRHENQTLEPRVSRNWFVENECGRKFAIIIKYYGNLMMMESHLHKPTDTILHRQGYRDVAREIYVVLVSDKLYLVGAKHMKKKLGPIHVHISLDQDQDHQGPN